MTKKLDHLQKALGHVEPKQPRSMVAPQDAPKRPVSLDNHSSSVDEICAFNRPESSMQFGPCFGLESHTTDLQFKQLGGAVLTSETISDLFTQ